MSLGGMTGGWRASRGEQGCVGGCSSRRWRQLGQQELFVEQTMCLDEHSCSLSRELVCWVVDCHCELSGACVAISVVVVAVWVLDTALNTIFGVVAVGFVVVGGDVAAATGGSR